MARPIITPGTVDWSGENPGMYLKQRADGPFVTLVSFFRVVLSPHGRGHALVLLEAPQVTGSRPDALNVCLSDNEPLARWLIAEFLASFGAFRGLPALKDLQLAPLHEVGTECDSGARYLERITGPDLEVDLVWEGLRQPFMIELPPEQSATGRHWMFSLFVEAAEATATVNGRRLEGRPVPRAFAGRNDSSTAFLAFSETWVRQ